jgi:hypothetical protein
MLVATIALGVAFLGFQITEYGHAYHDGLKLTSGIYGSTFYMLTGGTKTVYSWDTDKGGMSQKTETVKNHSEVLKNPLVNLNEEIQRLKYHRLRLFCSSQILFNISNKILQNSIYPV